MRRVEELSSFHSLHHQKDQPMSASAWKLCILVNNWVSEGPCIAEHGLSIAVKGGDLPDGQFVLFDTGKSKDVLVHNAKALNVDWQKIWQVIFSHSHYDHSGTLIEIARLSGRTIKVLTHPDTFTKKAKLTPCFRDIGIPFTKQQLEESELILSEVSRDTPLTPTLFLTGMIERVFGFEVLSQKDLFKKQQEDYVPDTVADDRALVIREPGVGFHLICGCCHSGLLNTLRHAAALTGERQVLTIAGGLHLGGYDTETMERVCSQLAEWNPRRIIPLHCTGLKGAAHLWKRFRDTVEFHGAGEEIQLI
jgi:7,8-dihydropterin-6-yl-methyl-4-(beta-D-ribofuranosyl)aminobenzene 5'-phosphate synthase